MIPELDLVLPCLDTGVSFNCLGGPCTVGLLAQSAKILPGEYAGYLVQQQQTEKGGENYGSG